MADFLGEAFVLVRPDVTKFAAELKAELTAATRGVTITVPVAAAAAAGTGALTTETAALTVVSKEASAAQKDLAVSSELAGAAAQKQAATGAELLAIQRKQAAQQAQLARGAAATGLSLLGARGATLAAGSAFLAGAASITLLAKAVKGAAEDEESLAAVSKVLGDALAQRLSKQASDLASQIGVVDDEILRFESVIGATFKNVGLGGAAIAQVSERLVRLAADMAAVKDVPVADTFKAIQSALLGNTRGLRQFGIEISRAAVTQRALTDSGKDNAKQLNQQEITLARYEVLLEKTTRFQGGFAEESGRLSGQVKILRANLDKVSDRLGRLLIPFLTHTVKLLNEGAVAAEKFADKLKDIPEFPGGGKAVDLAKKLGLTEDLPTVIDDFVNHLKKFPLVQHDVSQSTELALHAFNDYFAALEAGFTPTLSAVENLGQLDRQTKQFSTDAQIAAAATRAFNAALAGLQGQFLDLQFAGAPAAAQIGALQKELDKINARIAQRPGNVLGLKQQRNAVQAQIQAILDQQAADAEAAQRKAEEAARKAKEAAEAAKRARDEQRQFLIEQQQGFAELAITRAEGTKTLRDDIKTQTELLRLIEQEIRGLAAQIEDEKLRAQVLLQLRQQEAQVRNAIRDLRREQRAQAEERKRARAERIRDRAAARVESLDLDIQLAETQEDVKKQIRLHRAKIKALQDEQKLFKRGTREWKRLRNEIAAEKQAIKDLKKEVDDSGKAAKELAFSFLQAQQGFAATLISNLLPGSVLSAGGGGAGQAAVAGLLPRQRVPSEGGALEHLQAQAQVGGGRRSPTAGQQDAVIHVLRQILRVLQGRSADSAHPEARHQRSAGSAAMDIL